MSIPKRADVDNVLDALHAAATAADLDGYFALFHPEAVFVGTDRTEVWTMPRFRAFAEPHFAEAPAWSYTPGERQVGFGPMGCTAWFFEELEHDRWGDVRGSGALVRDGDRWLVTLYVLSFPVPNDVAPELVEAMRASHALDA